MASMDVLGDGIPYKLITDGEFSTIVRRAVRDEGFPDNIDRYMDECSSDCSGGPLFDADELMHAAIFVRRAMGIPVGEILINTLGIERNEMNPYGGFGGISHPDEVSSAFGGISATRRPRQTEL